MKENPPWVGYLKCALEKRLLVSVKLVSKLFWLRDIGQKLVKGQKLLYPMQYENTVKFLIVGTALIRMKILIFQCLLATSIGGIV